MPSSRLKVFIYITLFISYGRLTRTLILTSFMQLREVRLKRGSTICKDVNWACYSTGTRSRWEIYNLCSQRECTHSKREVRYAELGQKRLAKCYSSPSARGIWTKKEQLIFLLGREVFTDIREHFLNTRKHATFSRTVSIPVIERTSVCIGMREQEKTRLKW